MKRKSVATVLAFFFGIFGTHRFYLGQRSLGVLYLLGFFFSLAIIISGGPPLIIAPAILAFIDSILLLAMPQEEFDAKYNRLAYPAASVRQPPQARSASFSRKAAIQYYREGNFQRAAQAFERALELSPGDPTLHFNLACTYSMLEDPGPAFFHLEQAVASGFSNRDKIFDHPALGFLHSLPEMDDFIQHGFRVVQKEYPETLELPSLSGKEEGAASDEVPLDLLSKIEELAKLRDRGMLTEEEFQSQKSKWLRED